MVAFMSLLPKIVALIIKALRPSLKMHIFVFQPCCMSIKISAIHTTLV